VAPILATDDPKSVMYWLLPSNTRKTELPSAALTRLFLARLGARTAPFALLWETFVVYAGILTPEESS